MFVLEGDLSDGIPIEHVLELIAGRVQRQRSHLGIVDGYVESDRFGTVRRGKFRIPSSPVLPRTQPASALTATSTLCAGSPVGPATLMRMPAFLDTDALLCLNNGSPETLALRTTTSSCCRHEPWEARSIAPYASMNSKEPSGLRSSSEPVSWTPRLRRNSSGVWLTAELVNSWLARIQAFRVARKTWQISIDQDENEYGKSKRLHVGRRTAVA